MDYFWIRQDKRFLHVPIIKDLNKIALKKDFSIKRANKIDNRNVVYTESKIDLDYIDVLDTQIFLVSENVKNVFNLYDSRIQFKFFCLLNNTLNKYANYYAPILEEIDCCSNLSECNINKSYIKTLVIKKNIENSPIFKVANIYADVIVVRIDVAESLLRRNTKGIQFIRAFLE